MCYHVRKTHAHALGRVVADGDIDAFALQQTHQLITAGTHHCCHHQPRRLHIARRTHADGDAIQLMQEFAAP